MLILQQNLNYQKLREPELLNTENFLKNISIDCVIFGFHDNELKVLALHYKTTKEYSLPGGFIKKDESVENAAKRVLKERTGLDNIFLRQFKVFSDPDRAKTNPAVADIINAGVDIDTAFFEERFVSIGFYALVEYTKVNPTPDYFSESCEWISTSGNIRLLLDHNAIIDAALAELRLQLNNQPIGYNLLPEKFTMPELQKLYETILGKELDRRNFQRKILSYKILDKLEERRRGGAHKSPYLYSFNLKNYQKALSDGLSSGW